MELYVCSIRRNVLFVTLVLLAILGNAPHRTVHAQQGTTKRATAATTRRAVATTLAAVAGGRTTVINPRTTQAVQRTTQAGTGGATPRVTGGVTPRATGAVTQPGPTSPRATPAVTQPKATTPRPGGGGATQPPVVATTKGRVIRTRRPAGGSADSASPTTASSTSTESITTQEAGTTRGATTPTAAPFKITGFNIEYTLVINAPLKDNEDTCVSESTKDLANTFGISTSRITDVFCTAIAGTTDVKVTAKISSGTKPTTQDLKNFKSRTEVTTVILNGWQNSGGGIEKGSFKYTEVDTSSTSRSTKNTLLGLSEAHWIMIGMGSVILLLFIVSITVICIGRRGGESPRERMDEEASATSDAASEDKDIPKKKWYSFLQRRKKGDDYSDGNRTDDESAYESARGEDGSSSSDEESDKIHDDHKVV